MRKYFRKAAKTALILIYLVIVAGAVVRMTGSGMGCPDWPKCFGYYIPPTEETELQWRPNHFYKEGRIIIVDEELRITPKDFTSGNVYNDSNWDSYTKHDYAIFNPLHTWIEYVNRLLGALSGIPILVMAVLSFWFFRKQRWLTVVSWLTVFGMGFQAWLGKTVVDSNLAPYKITVHMVMALVIVAMLLYLIYVTRSSTASIKYDGVFRNVLIITILFTLGQIILGTQVRQYVDEQVKFYGYDAPEAWLSYPTFKFYFHRSFSILVFAMNAFLYYRNSKLQLGYRKMNWVMLLLFIEILSGMAMYYIDFPFGSQPLHLVIATLLFGVQFYLFLESRKAVTSVETL
ncbi:heme A synthase [Sungkyunkwania multivorans]|uniref:Heme A synthase n=1 Tax=Sungkyunkwania multivorans TaxID=1173618 RepID=A0ABW3CU42_9FLAO